jgi:hypothetical protein
MKEKKTKGNVKKMSKYANYAGILGAIQILLYQLEILSFEFIALTLILLVAICVGTAIDEFNEHSASSFEVQVIRHLLEEEWVRNKQRNHEVDENDEDDEEDRDEES